MNTPPEEVCLGACPIQSKKPESLSLRQHIRVISVEMHRLLERMGILEGNPVRDVMAIVNGSQMERYRAQRHIHHMQKGRETYGYGLPMPRHPHKK